MKTKVQAFLALIICTVVVGLVGGMPLANTRLEDGAVLGIVNSITSGFGSTLGSIVIIIGFGVMMGQIFEVTGAAKRMAHTFLKLFGRKREEEALPYGLYRLYTHLLRLGLCNPFAHSEGHIAGIGQVGYRAWGSPCGGACHHPLAGAANAGAFGRVRHIRG